MRLIIRLSAPVVGCIALCASLARTTGGETLRISSLSGDVRVLRAGLSAPGQSAKAGMTLFAGDSAAAGGTGRAELRMGDGSLIELQPNSTFFIEGLEESGARFKLSFGMILAKVHALAAGSHWEVRTPTAVCAVRGTELAVGIDDEQSTHAGVFDEGRLEVRSAAGQTVMIGPNKETSVRAGNAPAPAQALHYFQFAAQRMAALRDRQQHFLNQFKKKYRLPNNRMHNKEL